MEAPELWKIFLHIYTSADVMYGVTSSKKSGHLYLDAGGDDHSGHKQLWLYF